MTDAAVVMMESACKLDMMIVGHLQKNNKTAGGGKRRVENVESNNHACS
jgi:hypothetical protein